MIVAASVVLAAASAKAEKVFNLSGAVAFRDTSYRAITALYGANLGSVNADTPGNPASSTRVTWTGQIPNLFGPEVVTIHANYNGAVAGIQDLVQNRNVSYRSSPTPGDTNLINLPSDLAYGSVFQASTAFTSVPPLTDSKFGVTPVFFVKSVGTPATVTNITRQQLRALAANGALPLRFFTGDAADTNLLYYISRDPSAGQRVIIEKESTITGTPQFYQWSSNALEFVVDPTGRNSTQIRDQLNAATKPAISFLTGVDAVNVNGGQNIIGYNGPRAFLNAAYSSVTNDLTPVIYGQYSQWGYEHIFVRSTASADLITFRDALLGAIDTDLQTSAHSLPISKVKVTRNAEGGVVNPIVP